MIAMSPQASLRRRHWPTAASTIDWSNRLRPLIVIQTCFEFTGKVENVCTSRASFQPKLYYENSLKFDEVLTKTILHNFSRHGVECW